MSSQSGTARRADAIWIPAACACALALALLPGMAPWSVTAATLVSAWYMWCGKLESWHYPAMVALAGYMILAYGFQNWSFHIGGAPLPVGHVLCFVALGLAIRGQGDAVRRFLAAPVTRAWMLFAALAVTHLVVDLPKYGAYAARDASFVAEGCFMLLGYIWARDSRSRDVFLKFLAAVFILNLAYSFTYPWRGVVASMSPRSGALKSSVAIVGMYYDRAVILTVGSYFFLLVVRHLFAWSGATVYALAAAQIAWSFVFQARSMYVGIAMGVCVLFGFGGRRMASRLAWSVAVGLVVMFILLNVGNIQFRGRMGPMDPSFIVAHAGSLVGVEDAPFANTIVWRVEVLRSTLLRWMSSTRTIIIGEGFGDVLTSRYTPRATAIRQPHNTHVTVLARLGLIGLSLWIVIHLTLVRTFWRALRRHARGSFEHDTALWIGLYYLMTLWITSVQPTLEWPSASVPFWTIMGFAMATFRESTDADARR